MEPWMKTYQHPTWISVSSFYLVFPFDHSIQCVLTCEVHQTKSDAYSEKFICICDAVLSRLWPFCLAWITLLSLELKYSHITYWNIFLTRKRHQNSSDTLVKSATMWKLFYLFIYLSVIRYASVVLLPGLTILQQGSSRKRWRVVCC